MRSLQIVQRLHEAGHTAYYAGGWVRDLFLGHPSSEVDIATSASPQEVQRLFPKTIPVGIAFGVVIVVMEGENFEVATFRKDHPYQDGRHPDGVDFSSPEKDALRRDFTINGLFYDPLTEEIHDYVEGRADLKRRIIRAIGDPEARFAEDRLRMIRAVRFAARLSFRIEEKTAAAIEKYASTLFPSVSMERVWQELGKMERYAYAFPLLHRFGLLQTIFPQLKQTAIEEIEKRSAPLERFPKGCPPILYLREILPDMDGVVPYLKASKHDQQILDYFATQCDDLYDWAHFYAHPLSSLYLEIEKAKGNALASHRERKKRLKEHIGRPPLITAQMLKERGVEPGPRMGALLRQAERIAVNENLLDPEAILNRLLT